MVTEDRSGKPGSLKTRFGNALRIDEQWFEALNHGADEDEPSEAESN